MKYIITLNDKRYEVDVTETDAVITGVSAVSAPAPQPGPTAAPAAAPAPPGPPKKRTKSRKGVRRGPNKGGRNPLR